jgi:hypothetical protein
MKPRKRFWLSWIQPTPDYRPVMDPPNDAVLGWWCTGFDSNDSAILCAGVQASTPSAAKKAIAMDWPEAEIAVWRFCDVIEPPFKLSDRFPLKGWAKERWDRV